MTEDSKQQILKKEEFLNVLSTHERNARISIEQSLVSVIPISLGGLWTLLQTNIAETILEKAGNLRYVLFIIVCSLCSSFILILLSKRCSISLYRKSQRIIIQNDKVQNDKDIEEYKKFIKPQEILNISYEITFTIALIGITYMIGNLLTIEIYYLIGFTLVMTVIVIYQYYRIGKLWKT